MLHAVLTYNDHGCCFVGGAFFVSSQLETFSLLDSIIHHKRGRSTLFIPMMSIFLAAINAQDSHTDDNIS